MTSIDVAFVRTREGLLGASVGELALLAIPDTEAGFRIVTAYHLKKPPEEWTVVDFYGVSQTVATEVAFRAYVEEQKAHLSELAALDRRWLKLGVMTPWGVAQTTLEYGKGVLCHSTAEHGGFELTPNRNARVHAAWRNEDGWYEEDSQWAKVAASFPGLFTAFERKCADRSLRDWEPDAYERIFGVVLVSGESYIKDERRFKAEHAANWIVISAISSAYRPGFVECIATLGGDRRARGQRRFLVPGDEYRVGRHGFVIDEARHAIYDGPSSFIGWNRDR